MLSASSVCTLCVSVLQGIFNQDYNGQSHGIYHKVENHCRSRHPARIKSEIDIEKLPVAPAAVQHFKQQQYPGQEQLPALSASITARAMNADKLHIPDTIRKFLAYIAVRRVLCLMLNPSRIKFIFQKIEDIYWTLII